VTINNNNQAGGMDQMALDREHLQYAAAGAQVRIGEKFGDVWWSLLFRGLLALGLAIALFFWPQATLAIFIRLIGLYLLFDGVLNLLGALRIKEYGAYLVPGLITLVLGLILLFWPDMTGRLLLTIVGIWLLFQAAMLFWAARQSHPSDPDRGITMGISAITAIIGIVLVLWPGSGFVAISWMIAIAVSVIGILLISLALRLRQVGKRFDR
jgi:uncharacterized membrane protein HdeD (DUF308 family)